MKDKADIWDYIIVLALGVVGLLGATIFVVGLVIMTFPEL